jgi:hypothetical protein
MSVRGEVSVFVVATLLAGAVAGAAVPTAYFLYFAIASGIFDVGAMMGSLPIIALGGAIGFLLGCSAALGASIVGVWVRASRWGDLRLARYAAPLVGAYVVQLWAPLVLPGFPWLYALIVIPAATVAVTANAPWLGGYMNPSAVSRESRDDGQARPDAIDRTPTRVNRWWGEVGLAVGSIVVMVTFLVALVFAPAGSQEISAGSGPFTVVVVGLGVIGIVIAFVTLRPLNPGRELESRGAENHETEFTASRDTV